MVFGKFLENKGNVKKVIPPVRAKGKVIPLISYKNEQKTGLNNAPIDDANSSIASFYIISS